MQLDAGPELAQPHETRAEAHRGHGLHGPGNLYGAAERLDEAPRVEPRRDLSEDQASRTEPEDGLLGHVGDLAIPAACLIGVEGEVLHLGDEFLRGPVADHETEYDPRNPLRH